MAAGNGRERDRFRHPRGHVFERVHGEVYLAPEEGFVELAGEDVALVYDGERHVGVLLAGRLDDADLDLDTCGAQACGALFRLHEGEPGAAGTEDGGVSRGHEDLRRGRCSSTSRPSRAIRRRLTSELSIGEPASARAFISWIGPWRSLLTREWLIRSTEAASSGESSTLSRARASS